MDANSQKGFHSPQYKSSHFHETALSHCATLKKAKSQVFLSLSFDDTTQFSIISTLLSLSLSIISLYSFAPSNSSPHQPKPNVCSPLPTYIFLTFILLSTYFNGFHALHVICSSIYIGS